MKLKTLLLPALLVVVMAGAGCIFSPDNESGGGGGSTQSLYVFPDSPEDVMANFQTIYEQKDIDEFRSMLHPDYQTILQATTTALYPSVGDRLDLNEELTIHDNMFSGRPGVGPPPQNEFAPGIVDIQFNLLEEQQPWSTSPATDPIPNAEFSLYEVSFIFDRGEGFTLLRVQGQIKFYVTHRDSLHNGVVKPYYQMIGQQDLTQDS